MKYPRTMFMGFFAAVFAGVGIAMYIFPVLLELALNVKNPLFPDPLQTTAVVMFLAAGVLIVVGVMGDLLLESESNSV